MIVENHFFVRFLKFSVLDLFGDWLLICGNFFIHFVDSLIVAVKPKPPVKHLRDGFDDDDNDEDLVQLN